MKREILLKALSVREHELARINAEITELRTVLTTNSHGVVTDVGTTDSRALQSHYGPIAGHRRQCALRWFHRGH
jgi:hypothetical protein